MASTSRTVVAIWLLASVSSVTGAVAYWGASTNAVRFACSAGLAQHTAPRSWQSGARMLVPATVASGMNSISG
jgi:hypothetical protein